MAISSPWLVPFVGAPRLLSPSQAVSFVLAGRRAKQALEEQQEDLALTRPAVVAVPARVLAANVRAVARHRVSTEAGQARHPLEGGVSAPTPPLLRCTCRGGPLPSSRPAPRATYVGVRTTLVASGATH